MAHSHPQSGFRGRGFTLVEVLVSVGIIALLMSLLLPTLSKARESANRIACASNMRQIGTAFCNYLLDSRGNFPRPAAGQLPEDWIYWHPGRNLAESRIAPYLGNQIDAKLFTCPSDAGGPHAAGPYPFSYTVNESICHYLPSVRTMNMSQVRNSSCKILLIDESSQTVDDGCWAPQHFAMDHRNVLSNRHDQAAESAMDKSAGRGNVIFADFHYEYMERKRTFEPSAYDPLTP